MSPSIAKWEYSTGIIISPRIGYDNLLKGKV